MSKLSEFLNAYTPVWLDSGPRCSHAFRVHGDKQTARRSMCHTASREGATNTLPKCGSCRRIMARREEI